VCCHIQECLRGGTGVDMCWNGAAPWRAKNMGSKWVDREGVCDLNAIKFIGDLLGSWWRRVGLKIGTLQFVSYIKIMLHNLRDISIPPLCWHPKVPWLRIYDFNLDLGSTSWFGHDTCVKMLVLIWGQNVTCLANMTITYEPEWIPTPLSCYSNIFALPDQIFDVMGYYNLSSYQIAYFRDRK